MGFSLEIIISFDVFVFVAFNPLSAAIIIFFFHCMWQWKALWKFLVILPSHLRFWYSLDWLFRMGKYTSWLCLMEKHISLSSPYFFFLLILVVVGCCCCGCHPHAYGSIWRLYINSYLSHSLSLSLSISFFVEVILRHKIWFLSFKHIGKEKKKGRQRNPSNPIFVQKGLVLSSMWQIIIE